MNEINYRLGKAYEVGLLSQKEFTFLKVEEFNILTFYVTPKLYKSFDKPLGRLIVSGVGGPLEEIGKYIDKSIKHLNK